MIFYRVFLILLLLFTSTKIVHSQSGNVEFHGALMPDGIVGDSGQVLISQGPNLAPKWVNKGDAIPQIKVISTNSTWNKPDGLKYIVLEIVGAGGGGGGTGGDDQVGSGGGGGGYLKAVIAASSLDASEPVVVGVGGSGGTSIAFNGVSGGLSSFASIYFANGGSGGNNGGSGGSGGSASNGDININGGNGGPGTLYGNDENPGFGGSSILGFGGTSNGANGNTYGGGGAGHGDGSGGNGGNGANGIVIITEFY